jgi:diamine N-acetyltransferase
LNDLALVEVTKENLPELLEIKLFHHQEPYLPTIESSLEMAERYPDARSLGIRLGHEICGFALYGIDEQTGCWKIFRFYIDKEYQSLGIGRKAIELLLDLLHDEQDATEVLVVYNEDNKVAERLYEKPGFAAYGRNGDKVLSKLLIEAGT